MFSQGTASPNASAKLSEPAVQQSEDIIMTLTEPSSKANLGMGRTIDIKLRSASNLNWNFDKEYKSLEYLSSRDEDGFFHIVFKAKAPGKETVYFDCLDVADPMNVKVLDVNAAPIFQPTFKMRGRSGTERSSKPLSPQCDEIG